MAGAAAAGAALLCVATVVASAHWLAPAEIVAGISNDAQLRRSFGVAAAHADAQLPRLLIISVQRDVWDTAPEAARRTQAEEWFETWRHSVPEGIVAVLDAATEESLVNFDGIGHASLKPARARTPPPPSGH